MTTSSRPAALDDTHRAGTVAQTTRGKCTRTPPAVAAFLRGLSRTLGGTVSPRRSRVLDHLAGMAGTREDR